MSIDDVISYADIYEGHLTDSHMQYFDALGVQWRGRNVFEIRDEVCIKIIQIFSQVYQQTALTNPTALPQLRAEIIQHLEGVFGNTPEGEDEPSPLVYRFDPISGTHCELTVAEGFWKNALKKTVRVLKFVLPPLPTPRNLVVARELCDRIMHPVTRPIEKAEEKIAEWAQKHPVAATAIGVAVVVTFIIVLGPGANPIAEAAIETAAAAGVAAAATPSDKDDKPPTPSKSSKPLQTPKLTITYPPESPNPPSYLEGVADRLKDVGRAADDVLQSSVEVLKESSAALTHLLWKTTGIAGETLIGTTEILGSPLYIPERNQLVRDIWTQEIVPSIHEKIDQAFSTNSKSDFDRRNDGAFKQGLDSFMLNPLLALGGPVVSTAASVLGQEAVAASTALSKASAASNAARTNSVVSQALRGGLAAQEVATVRAVEDISVVGKVASAEARTANAQALMGKSEALSVEVVQLEKKLSEWLGKGSKLIRNEAGDPVLLSKDGLRCVRLDFNKTKPHDNPHAHTEMKIDGKWVKSERIESPATIAESEAYIAAKNGGRHADLIPKFSEKPIKEIEKSIRSYEKLIVEHKDKIANPSKYCLEWDTMDPRGRDALINKRWPAEIQCYTEQKDILKALLDQRQ